jgi:hypothetical protein
MLLISKEGRFDPKLYSEEELRAALQCLGGFFDAYLRAGVSGESVDWEDLDKVIEFAGAELPRLVEANERAFNDKRGCNVLLTGNAFVDIPKTWSGSTANLPIAGSLDDLQIFRRSTDFELDDK